MRFCCGSALVSLCECPGAGSDALRSWGGRAGVVTPVTALRTHSKGTLGTEVTSAAGLSENTLEDNANPFHSSSPRYFIQISPLFVLRVRSCVSFGASHEAPAATHNCFILTAAHLSYSLK